MQTVFIYFISICLCIVSIDGLLKPRMARRRRTHYNKVAIKSNIRKNKLKKTNKFKLKSHTSSSSSSSVDITTATTEQWNSCNELYFDQGLDHFGSGVGPDDVKIFSQRYYVCGKDLFEWQPNNPIFFYCGNEADVTAYIDYTGFMWENAADFNALLIFAEHRYYGESLPYTEEEIIDDTEKLKYLTTDQTLEDYAILLDYLKKNTFGFSDEFNGQSSYLSPIIGFGGSYGGMLAAWFRMKYPQYMDGAIAGSAPILGVFGLDPASDPYAFASQETYDCSVDVGVDNGLCIRNFKTGWNNLYEMTQDDDGRTQIGTLFNLCSTPTEDNAIDILSVVEESIAYMAMSSYPYSSNYISGAVLGSTTGGLPAYPVTYGCNEYLTQEFDSAIDRVTAIANFNDIFWNADGSSTCIDLDNLWNTYNDYIWDYLYCRSLLMPSGQQGGDADMFWTEQWSSDDTITWCNEEYNIAVDIHGPASRRYGGRDLYKSLSNVVFSNGDMDPWMPGGVVDGDCIGGNSNSESIVTIMINQAGHHLDLMFSNSNDHPSVVDARQIELDNIQNWIDQANNKYNMGMCDANNAEIELVSHPFITAMNMLM